MFSEYASKFLAQSQSRISFASPNHQQASARPTNDGKRQAQALTGHAQRSNIYRPSQSGFRTLGFGSRIPHDAPLFHSINEETAMEGDEENEEHEREVADYFALQRSRKHFVHGRLDESSDAEEIQGRKIRSNETGGPETPQLYYGNIKSSWYGNGAGSHKPDHWDSDVLADSTTDGDHRAGMGDTLKSVDLDIEHGHLPTEWQSMDSAAKTHPLQGHSFDSSTQISVQKIQTVPGLKSAAEASVLTNTSNLITKYNDRIWGRIYVIALVSFFTSFTLVWLRVSTKPRLGDTVYNTIMGSRYMLLTDTALAVVVSMIWLATLRSYARPLVYMLLLGVPIVLFAFCLYPFICSFQTADSSTSLQSMVMRLVSFVPLCIGILWTYSIFTSRHAFNHAIRLLELAIKILLDYPSLGVIGLATLFSVVLWSWTWIGIFTRVFLGGHMSKSLFVIDTGAWCLGALYVFFYLWTLNVIAGIQQATVAAAVSQWYFHRSNSPPVPSYAVARAALSHALTSCFGTVCLSTLLSLSARLPVLVLPRRFTVIAALFSTALLPEDLLLLTHPITLTQAAIHDQSLREAAQSVSRYAFAAGKHTSGVQRIRMAGLSVNRPHRLALLVLTAMRLVVSIGFGFGAWVHAAKTANSEATGTASKGSLYGYVVGLIAGIIGWAVIGAMEGVLTGIVDAVVVCWESEISAGTQSSYCEEANSILAFGDGVGDPEVNDHRYLLRSQDTD